MDWFEGVYPASESLLSMIADINPGVLIYSLGGRVLYCNRSAVDLLGRSHEDILADASLAAPNNVIHGVIHDDGTAFPAADHPVQRVIRTGNASSTVVMGITRQSQGDMVWLEVSADPLIAPDGGVSRVVCTLSDITARKVAEERILQSQACLRAMADTAPVLIWVSGPDMMCTFVNKPWLKFTGRTMEQELGEGWTEGAHPDDLDRLLETFRSAFDSRAPFSADYRLRRFDGEYRWILDQGVPWWMPDSSFGGYIGCGIDITEMKRAREEAVAESRRSTMRAQLGAFMAEHGKGLQATLARAARILTDHLETSQACIWVRTKDDGALKLEGSAGSIFADARQAAHSMRSINVDATVSERSPRVISIAEVIAIAENEDLARLSILTDEGIASLATCPLIVEGRLIGLLGAFSQDPAASQIMQDLASVADILALGIERKRVEESLAINQEITNWVLESSQDCIKILDLEGNLLYLNAGGLQVLEIDDLSSVIGREWTTFYTGAYRVAARGALAAARAGGRGTMQGRFSSKSGRISWWDVVISPITNGQGKIDRLLAVSRDVTLSKEAEEELRVALEEVRRLKDQLHQENVYLQEEIKLEHNFDQIVGETEAIRRVLYKVEQVAPLETTVLILGETGSGKELVARAIHSLSARKDRPLVKVNCAALPASLIESELFGHERGAFTDAHARKIGRFELANGGTIFLDEVGELPLDLQAKLLRVLQDGEFERLGSSSTLKVDTRILAATNRDLKAEMREGRFRGDLWYRLSVFPVTVPPLRDRKEDIPLLVRNFAGKLSKKLGKSIKAPSPEVMSKLQSYGWPGNVRELANVVERAIIDARGETLEFGEGIDSSPSPSARAVGHSLEEFERGFIIETLRRAGDRIEGKSGAAQSLGLNPSTLRTRMKKLGIHRGREGGFS
jgi:PAS domain S-box-containing protein